MIIGIQRGRVAAARLQAPDSVCRVHWAAIDSLSLIFFPFFSDEWNIFQLTQRHDSDPWSVVQKTSSIASRSHWRSQGYISAELQRERGSRYMPGMPFLAHKVSLGPHRGLV